MATPTLRDSPLSFPRPPSALVAMPALQPIVPLPARLPVRRVQPDLICFSCSRWESTWQRTQQLMTRFARQRRVFFVERPHHSTPEGISMQVHTVRGGVQVARPHMPAEVEGEYREVLLAVMVRELLSRWRIDAFVAWYDDPRAMAFTKNLQPLACVYDSAREDGSLQDDRPETRELERELLERASIVLVGERLAFENTRRRHSNVHCIPSSFDRELFAAARDRRPVPIDQASLPRPIVGHAGIIDERMDMELLVSVVRERRDVTFVMIGDLAPGAPSRLPEEPNLHWFGPRRHDRLPDYLAGWGAAIMPFRTTTSRTIETARAAEYLAAGRPVITTPVPDVVAAYGRVVSVAGSAIDFARALDGALREGRPQEWLDRVDLLLSSTSWEKTWSRAAGLIDARLPPERPTARIGRA